MPNANEEDLLVHVRGGASEERTAALKELLGRASTRVRPVLGMVIADSAAPVELKTIAAHALGQEATPENEATLLTALASDQLALVIAAAKSLGRIGGPKAHEALLAVRAKEGLAVARSVVFARTLLSYRLGLGRERLKPPVPSLILEVNRRSAVPLRFETIEPRVLRESLPVLKRELPAIPIAETGSVRFSCRAERLWLVLTAQIVGSRAETVLGQRERMAAVVLKESSCPEGWYVYEYFLTHPRGTNTAAIFGLRPSGGLCHYGEISLDGAHAHVQLRAVNTPGVLAIEIAAEFQSLDGALVIREALAATASQEGQKRPAMPRRDAVPRS